MLTEDLPKGIDVTIDGADEVDPQLNLIKGGGGALLREKLVAQASKREIIVVDESKLSPRLGHIACFANRSASVSDGGRRRAFWNRWARSMWCAKLRMAGNTAPIRAI